MNTESVFDHYQRRTELGEDRYEEENCLRPYRKYEQDWHRFGWLFSGLQNWAMRDEQAAPVAFVGSLFNDLIQTQAQAGRVVLFDVTQLDYAMCRKQGISAQPVWRERIELHRIYLEYRSTGQLDHPRLQKVISGFQNRFEKLQIKTLILWNDVMFAERCMILAARALGIPSLLVQHGVYMTHQADARIIGGNWADYVLTWGEFFSDMFVNSGITTRDKIKLLGYPRAFNPLPYRESPESPIVCLLGQDWELYGTDLEKGKRRFTQTVIDASKAVGLPVVYRPHPGESRAWIQAHFPQMTMTLVGETLHEAFEKYDVFVSLTSTALLEASLHNRIALEIIDPSFVQDDFAQIGACYSRPNDIEALKEFLTLVKTKKLRAFQLHERYVWHSTNLAGRLKTVLDEVRTSDFDKAG
jgi:hypothetical protein